jgi:hypothetical protein
MPEFFGSAVIVQWSGTGGTIDLSADQRAVTFAPSVQMDDVSTSSQGYKTYLTALKDFTVSYKGLYQTGTAGVGSATEDALAPGQVGTIYCYPLGSVAGTANRKYTWPVVSQGIQQNWAYANITELNCSFQGNGTITYGTGA